MSEALKWIGRFEGASLILLLFITMPLKYLWGLSKISRVTGLIHGVLFLLYVSHLLKDAKTFGWKKRLVLTGLLVSFIPFGTFYFERKLIDSLDLSLR